jgi:hypothetical protein
MPIGIAWPLALVSKRDLVRLDTMQSLGVRCQGGYMFIHPSLEQHLAEQHLRRKALNSNEDDG